MNELTEWLCAGTISLGLFVCMGAFGYAIVQWLSGDDL